MNEKECTRISKFLSLILRHEPERAGISLDPEGWVEVETLIEALGRSGYSLDRPMLDVLVETNSKKRFAYSEDGNRIRANQGHTVEVTLGYSPQIPPARLYHGTATRFLDGIRRDGLQKRERHHVHLSADLRTAEDVGRRHGKPIVLTINSEAMHAQGYPFYLSENGVWLADHVPVEFLEFPQSQVAGNASPGRTARSRIAQETVAICGAGEYQCVAGSVVRISASLDAAVAGTVLYRPEEVPNNPETRGARQGVISITGETTIEAIRRLAAEDGGHLACLNFASAKNPGGGFLGGSQAQEESLARSSGLYPCLLAAPEYYERNRDCRTAMYLDLAIWSPHVPFFRDDSGGLLEQPVLASVITAPAPNAGAIAAKEPSRLSSVESALRARARLVLSVATARDVRRLVLGAWGCGVFRNDPTMVARVFGDLLKEEGWARSFDEVLFAILDRSSDAALRRAFSEALV